MKSDPIKGSNNRWRIVVQAICLMALLSTFPVTALGQAFSDSETATVVAIEINGNDRIERFEIVSALPFKVGDEIVIRDDVLRGEIRVRNLGYFQEVAGSSRASDEGDGIVVTYEIFENPVIREIEVTGNRNWNEDKRLEFLGLSMPWPFVNYIVTPERIFKILEAHDIKKGEVFNAVKFQKALGINEVGACAERPASPSICKEYTQTKELPFFGIGNAEMGEVVRIDLVEGVLESIEITGVEGPFLEKAEEILGSLPVLKPLKVPELQTALRNLVQSVYFEPLQNEDYNFEFGAGPDRVIMSVNLSPNTLLDQPEVINEFGFDGNVAFGDGELRRKIEFEPGLIDNYTALQAIEGVHRFYQKEGFIMTQVALGSLEDGLLTLDINEGLIDAIEIRQNGIPTAMLQIDAELEAIPLDEVLVQEALARDAEQGEPSVLGIEDESHPLVKTIESFSKFLSDVLGTSASSGLPYTQPEIIVKEMTLKPGEYLNQFDLAETYRQLLDLGYFKEVLFDFQIDPDTENVLVIVDVQEQDRLGDFRFGGAVSQDGLVGQLSVRSKNLQGTGQDVSVELDRGILGKAVVNWSLGYQNRTILKQADYFSIDLFNKYSREGSPRPHLLNRLGGEASLAYPFNEIQFVLGFRHEFFTKEFDPPKNDEEDPLDGEPGEVEPTPTPELQQSTLVPLIEEGTSNVLSLTVNHDNRNNPIFATRGGRRSLTFERAGLLAGSEEFMKIRGALIHHIPTIEDHTIAARFVGGWGDDLPSQEKFVVGGSTTVRGIQPKFTDSMAFLNLEYRILIENGFSLALFVDAGSDMTVPDLNFARLKKSFGIEGRITIPYAGPIRIAFAWPVTDKIEYFKAEFGFGTFF